MTWKTFIENIILEILVLLSAGVTISIDILTSENLWYLIPLIVVIVLQGWLIFNKRDQFKERLVKQKIINDKLRGSIRLIYTTIWIMITNNRDITSDEKIGYYYTKDGIKSDIAIEKFMTIDFQLNVKKMIFPKWEDKNFTEQIQEDLERESNNIQNLIIKYEEYFTTYQIKHIERLMSNLIFIYILNANKELKNRLWAREQERENAQSGGELNLAGWTNTRGKLKINIDYTFHRDDSVPMFKLMIDDLYSILESTGETNMRIH